jgi:hypothetical protein
MSDFSTPEEHTVARIRVTFTPRATYGFAMAADLAGVDPGLLAFYCEAGLLGAERTEAATATFDDDALFEIRRIEEVRRRYAVDRRALPLLSGLWREVERLQAELRFLRGP